jgi:hypothetical protein
MKKAQKLATAVTAAALFVGISAANAANMADYEKAKAAAMAEINKVEAEGVAAWNPHAKDPVMQHGDELAAKGDFEGAVKYADTLPACNLLRPRNGKASQTQPIQAIIELSPPP